MFKMNQCIDCQCFMFFGIELVNPNVVKNKKYDHEKINKVICNRLDCISIG